MRESHNEKLIREGRRQIEQKEKELYRQQRLTEKALQRKERVHEELDRASSTGASFAKAIDDLGVSLNEAISGAFRRMAGKD